MVEASRIKVLNDRPVVAGKYVLYWMQASQREQHNAALEHAISVANQLGQPLVVCFGMLDDYPEANERHYAFMLQGMQDLQVRLEARGILFLCKRGNPVEVALHFAGGGNASVLVCDRGYTRHQKAWRAAVAGAAACKVVQVEADVVIPVEAVSDHHEFAARTIRPKIHRLWEQYLVPLARTKLKHPSVEMKLRADLDVSDPDAVLAKLSLDRSVKPTAFFQGGQTAGQAKLTSFVADMLAGYDEGRNEPASGWTSGMSMYLHFGMISPVEIALAAKGASGTPAADLDSYLEELIVRRELSMNFVHFNPKYDSYDCLPDWAKKTLAEHAKDKRPVLYTREQLETAQTHDPYWNAAQLEMTKTGFMHNYMRMYWGKKILEWTASPEEAFATTLHLNNKYFLDGRDPNAFANVGWVFGLHDRPWTRRPIFGTIRYMNAAGLERKFEIGAYVKKVALL